jgi:uncharacterized membrane protein HdeD (DUF308 family)
MKTLRYIAALLMILTGVLHILPFFQASNDSNALPMLAFGSIYLVIGILLIRNMKFAPALGIIFPLMGLGAGVFVIGLKNVNMMLGIMFAIDVVVLWCCCVLFFKKTTPIL